MIFKSKLFIAATLFSALNSAHALSYIYEAAEATVGRYLRVELLEANADGTPAKLRLSYLQRATDLNDKLIWIKDTDSPLQTLEVGGPQEFPRTDFVTVRSNTSAVRFELELLTNGTVLQSGGSDGEAGEYFRIFRFDTLSFSRDFSTLTQHLRWAQADTDADFGVWLKKAEWLTQPRHVLQALRAYKLIQILQ